MKSIYLTIIGTCLFQLSFAQTLVVAVEDFKNKWGFANPDGTEIIAPNYIDAHPFSQNGIAFVNDEKAKSWKCIDVDGSEISIPIDRYEPWGTVYAQGMTDNIQVLRAKKMFYAVNDKGELIYENYNEMSYFKNGYSIAKKDGSFYILDTKGTSVKVTASTDHLDDCKDGLIPYRSNKLFGFIDLTGQSVIDAKFERVGYFDNGIAWARTTDGKVGYINTSGEWVIEPKYDRAEDLDPINHVATASIGEKYLIVDNKGNETEINNAVKIGNFSEGIAWIRIGEKVGAINHKGEFIIEAKYDKVEKAKYGTICVKQGDMWGAFDLQGNVITEPKYTRVEELKDDRIAVRVGEKWGFIDVHGEMVIQPQFDAIRDFKNGYAAVRIEDKWGLIDKSGEFTIQPKYHRIKDVEIVNK